MPSGEEMGVSPWALRSKQHQGFLSLPLKELKEFAEDYISEAWRCNSCVFISCWKRLCIALFSC